MRAIGLAAVAAWLLLAAGCAGPDGETQPSSAVGDTSARASRDTTAADTAADPHAGHDMPAAADHAEHGAGGATAASSDEHAGHTRTAAAATAGHDAHPQRAAAPAAGDHAQHGAGAGAGGRVATGAGEQVATGVAGQDKMMELIRALVEDPAVQRRIQQDSRMRELWSDSAVRNHITAGEHQH